MNKQKRISVDCNCNHEGYDKPLLSIFEIEFLGLKEGEEVFACQDEQEWLAKVCKDASSGEDIWYLQLGLEQEVSVSEEKVTGRDEGFMFAIPIGELRGETNVVTKMLADGLDIDTVSKYTRLTIRKLKEIKESIGK